MVQGTLFKKGLINHSTSPSSEWSEAKRADWDKIIDLPVPDIPASWDRKQVEDCVYEHYRKITDLIHEELQSEYRDWFVTVEGELSYSYMLVYLLKVLRIPVVVPVFETLFIVDQGDFAENYVRFVKWRGIWDM